MVLITDGVDTAGVKAERESAIKALIDTRTTVHIISYTEFVRQKNPKKKSDIQGGMRPADPITANDPTLAPGQTRTPSFGVSITFDPAMRRQRKAYEDQIKKSQQSLSALAAETGGTIFLPKTNEEMISEAAAVAREIGAEYVITYRPTRPLASAPKGEYRHIEVASRRLAYAAVTSRICSERGERVRRKFETESNLSSSRHRDEILHHPAHHLMNFRFFFLRHQ